MDRYLLSACRLLPASACATVQDPAQPHRQQAFAARSPVPGTVNIIGDSLQKTCVRSDGMEHVSTRLAVEGAGEAQMATAGRKVWAAPRNLTAFQQTSEAGATWCDAAARPFEGPSAPSRHILRANGGLNRSTQSDHLAASQFHVEIRELR